MTSSVTCTEMVSPAKVDESPCTLLPSLRNALPSTVHTRTRRTTSVDFDDFCRRDNMLFLRLGQGTNNPRAVRAGVQDYLRVTDDAADTRSVAETEFDECDDHSPQSLNSARKFPSFSPPPPPPPMDGFRHADREAQLGSVQRDVYDVSPPPGYKKLKRVQGRSFDNIDKSLSVTAAMDQLLHPPDGGQARKYHHHHHYHCSPTKLPPLGDGFSGDETQPRKKVKADSMPRAFGTKANRNNNKNSKRFRGSKRSQRVRSNPEESDSTWSNQKLQNRLDNNASPGGPGKKKRGRGDPAPSSLLGPLDVVSLSQEDLEAAKVAARAAAISAAKSRDIAQFVIPLRPRSESPGHRQRIPWSLGLDEDVQEGDDGEKGEDLVFDVDGSVDEVDDVAEVSQSNRDASLLSALPSLRQH